jgi:hypothetical protein
MAVLAEAERFKVFAQYMRGVGGFTGMVKPDLKAAVDSTDDWVEANQASFVTSLPTNFRTNSTPVQKTLLLMYVVMRRMGKLWVEGD